MTKENSNSGISVLIISVENKNIRTEEIYFKNRKNTNSLSLAKDQNFAMKN